MWELAVLGAFGARNLAVLHSEYYVTLLGSNCDRICTFGLSQSRRLVTIQWLFMDPLEEHVRVQQCGPRVVYVQMHL